MTDSGEAWVLGPETRNDTYNIESISAHTPPPSTSDNDLWAHRSSRMVCKTCMWYVPKVLPEHLAVPDALIGRCRRRAPTMDGYPVVYQTDWCGDHKLDETKLL